MRNTLGTRTRPKIALTVQTYNHVGTDRSGRTRHSLSRLAARRGARISTQKTGLHRPRRCVKALKSSSPLTAVQIRGCRTVRVVSSKVVVCQLSIYGRQVDAPRHGRMSSVFWLKRQVAWNVQFAIQIFTTGQTSGVQTKSSRPREIIINSD
jgi:hypothetical protein